MNDYHEIMRIAAQDLVIIFYLWLLAITAAFGIGAWFCDQRPWLAKHWPEDSEK